MQARGAVDFGSSREWAGSGGKGGVHSSSRPEIVVTPRVSVGVDVVDSDSGALDSYGLPLRLARERKLAIVACIAYQAAAPVHPQVAHLSNRGMAALASDAPRSSLSTAG